MTSLFHGAVTDSGNLEQNRQQHDSHHPLFRQNDVAPSSMGVHMHCGNGLLNTKSFDGNANEAAKNQSRSHRRTQSLGVTVLHRSSMGHGCGASFGFSHGHSSNPFDPLCSVAATGHYQPAVISATSHSRCPQEQPRLYLQPTQIPPMDQILAGTGDDGLELSSPKFAITPGNSTIASASLPPDPMAGRGVVFEFPPDFQQQLSQAMVPTYEPHPQQVNFHATPAPMKRAHRRIAPDTAPTKMWSQENRYERPTSPVKFRAPLQALSPNAAHRDDFDNDSLVDYIPPAPSDDSSSFVHPDKRRMKMHRKRCTASGAVTGAIVGGVALGPFGAVLGGAAAGIFTKKACKASEKRAQRKMEERASTVESNLKGGMIHSGTFA